MRYVLSADSDALVRRLTRGQYGSTFATTPRYL